MPCVPVLEHQRLVIFEQGTDIAGAFVREEVAEARVSLHVAEEFKGRVGAVFCWMRGGVGGVVEVFVHVVVGGGGHGEGFHCDFAGGEFVGVAEVDERVADCISFSYVSARYHYWFGTVVTYGRR